MRKAADMFFARCMTNWWMMQHYPEMVLTVRLEDLIADPKRHLGQMCQFLDVAPEESYLEACASVLFSKPRQSHLDVPWNPEMIRYVRDRMEDFPFLQGYESLAASTRLRVA